jgi:hypothetical protein
MQTKHTYNKSTKVMYVLLVRSIQKTSGELPILLVPMSPFFHQNQRLIAVLKKTGGSSGLPLF